MHRYSLLVALLSGCLHHTPATAVDGAVLGRVVIYRNGVAFYERKATVENGQLAVRVPRDRVDDFLKSLTVVDPSTKKPIAVSIPRKEADDGSYLTMTIETPQKHADVLLTYVTEAPAWKPSYRVVVGDQGKVMLEGWAIVDNVSGEDWKGVLVGVGASSAMSFRYDLWSVRRIDRDLLQGEDKFAVAPPTGVSPYVEGGGEELGSLDPSEVRGGAVASKDGQLAPGSLENQYYVDGVNTSSSRATSSPVPAGSGKVQGVVSDKKTGQPLAGVTVIATGNKLAGTQTAISDDKGFYTIDVPAGTYTLSYYYGDVTLEHANVAVRDGKATPVYQKMDQSHAGGEVIKITSSAPMIDQTSTTSGIVVDKNYIRNLPLPGRTFETTLGTAAGTQGDALGTSFSGSSSAENTYQAPPPIKQGDAKLEAIAKKITSSSEDIVIESHGLSLEDAKQHGEAVRNKLIDDGVPAKRIKVAPQAGGSGLRLVAVAAGAGETRPAPPTAHITTSDAPVGESHFMADRPMNVKAGSSAMVAMVHGETEGGVVYLFDPISERGDKRFAFKSVKLTNPTTDTLEPGPVTVYGDGRFIGEGITEPVPPKASVVVPFASDRQIVVEEATTEKDKIARLMTAQRGIVTAEVQHRKATTYTITSRLDKPAKVFVRHKTGEGWKVVEAPPKSLKVGDSQLYEVDLAPFGTQYVKIAETTPMERSLQLASDEALGLMKVYIDEPDASPELKKQIETVLATHRDAVDLVDKIQTMHDQLGEYRERSGELHAQLVTLKMVKTGGELMQALRNKLAETSDKQQKLTIAIVDAQEALMLTKVKFQNELAELHLTDASALSSSR
ncbi:MAG: carboxypeptidase regulatory-like domain-containing protein [Kofleriaceae bacterium]